MGTSVVRAYVSLDHVRTSQRSFQIANESRIKLASSPHADKVGLRSQSKRWNGMGER